MNNLYNKALVTGATGFLGSHLSYFLAKQGYKVTLIKRSTSSVEWHNRILNYLQNKNGQLVNPSFTWVEADLLDPASLLEAMANQDFVFHCGAMVSFDSGHHDSLMEVNVEGTANVVNACLASGIIKLIHVSSTAAIGRVAPDVVIDEEKEWEDSKHNTKYAISKYLAEMEVWRGSEEGLSMVIVNPSVILGVGNWSEGSASIFNRIYNGLKFYPPGGNAFVDAEDVATIMIKLAESDISSQRFLLVSENLPFKTLFDQIATAFGKKTPSIKIRLWMANLAWRASKFLSLFSSKPVFITKETAIASQHQYLYNNNKIKKALNINFIPVSETIKNTANEFIKEKAGR